MNFLTLVTNKLYLLTGHNADDIAETVIMNGKGHKGSCPVQFTELHMY